MALEQEKRVSEEIFALFELARELKDYRAEQFLQWFVKEQVEEVALMGDLLNVVERSKREPAAGRGLHRPREPRRRGRATRPRPPPPTGPENEKKGVHGVDAFLSRREDGLSATFQYTPEELPCLGPLLNMTGCRRPQTYR